MRHLLQLFQASRTARRQEAVRRNHQEQSDGYLVTAPTICSYEIKTPVNRQKEGNYENHQQHQNHRNRLKLNDNYRCTAVDIR